MISNRRRAYRADLRRYGDGEAQIATIRTCLFSRAGKVNNQLIKCIIEWSRIEIEENKGN